MCFAHTWLILRFLYIFHVCLSVNLHLSCARQLHYIHCCHVTLHWWTWQLLCSLSVVLVSLSMSSLAQLWVWHTKEQRQCRHVADREWKCQKWTGTHDAYRGGYPTENGCQECRMDWNFPEGLGQLAFRYELVFIYIVWLVATMPTPGSWPHSDLGDAWDSRIAYGSFQSTYITWRP